MKKIILGAMIMTAIMFNANMVKGEEAMIEEGKVVQFDYQLKVDDKVVDSSEKRGPLEYTHGSGMIIKGLEKEMEGMEVGDEKNVVVPPNEGYGQVDEKAVVEIPKQNLGEDIDPQEGMVLQLQNQQGQNMAGKIVDVKENSIMLDFNHPLAGEELEFSVKIVDIK
jgi:FKBP-type peptidyl-prolyl cis-trans isomerase 2